MPRCRSSADRCFAGRVARSDLPAVFGGTGRSSIARPCRAERTRLTSYRAVRGPRHPRRHRAWTARIAPIALMATTLADLLDALGDEATLRTDTIDPLDFVDADRALALLGRTLQRLVDDGLTTWGGTDRGRWVGEAARASAGGAAAVTARPWRLAQLAGAA